MAANWKDGDMCCFAHFDGMLGRGARKPCCSFGAVRDGMERAGIERHDFPQVAATVSTAASRQLFFRLLSQRSKEQSRDSPKGGVSLSPQPPLPSLRRPI